MKSLSSALKTIRRSPYQAMIAITMASLTFFVAFAASYIAFGAHTVLQYVESQPQVIAFFELGTSKNTLDEIVTSFTSNPDIKQVQLVTQEQALEIYRKENSNDPLLLELVTADILPASIEIQTYSLGKLEEVKNSLSEYSEIEEVIYQQEVIDSIKRWTSAIRAGGLAVTIIVSVISFFSILVVIALKTTNQKTTISIVRLLGATKTFIKLPFIIEGVLYSVLGCLIGWLLSFATLYAFLPNITAYFGDYLQTPLSAEIIFLQLAIGLGTSIILGASAGWLAVSRLLRL